MNAHMRRTLTVLLSLSLAASSLAQDAAIEDGKERAAWQVRPDPGARYVKLSQDPRAGTFGKQYGRFRLDAESSKQGLKSELR